MTSCQILKTALQFKELLLTDQEVIYHEIIVCTSESVFQIKSSVKVELNVKAGFPHDIPDALCPVWILVCSVVCDRRRNVSPQTVIHTATPR
jgi:hypothetical protein